MFSCGKCLVERAMAGLVLVEVWFEYYKNSDVSKGWMGDTHLAFRLVLGRYV